jgi:hypothetical protein
VSSCASSGCGFSLSLDTEPIRMGLAPFMVLARDPPEWPWPALLIACEVEFGSTIHSFTPADTSTLWATDSAT